MARRLEGLFLRVAAALCCCFPHARFRETAGILAALSLALGASTSALAQKQAGKGNTAPSRILLAVNEGGAVNADAMETVFRFADFGQVVEKTLRMPVTIIPARDRNAVLAGVQRQAFTLLLARPNDVPAQAVRDFGYVPVVTEKVPAQVLFIVRKDSPLQSITDVKGKTFVTPDQYSNIWRMANALLRDNKISFSNENVRAMRDQAAIGWSMENGFFDVGVVNSVSAVGRTWEKNGGRVLARGPETPNMPLIASPQLSAAQIAKLRAALIALDSSDDGKALLKKIGLTGFKETSPKVFLDFLSWLGELEVAKQ
jgi:ABC-type phosphate/phosphonate transport system substrate-binding protein